MPARVRVKDLPFPIKRLIAAEGRLYVLASPPPLMGSFNNLLAMDRSGRILWRVGPPEEDGLREPFVEMTRHNSSYLLAMTASGRRFAVDCLTGAMRRQI